MKRKNQATIAASFGTVYLGKTKRRIRREKTLTAKRKKRSAK